MDKSLQNAQVHVEDAKVVGAETGVKLKAQTGMHGARCARLG